MTCRLIHGDCIKEMNKLIDEGVKVDLVLTDPPYGTTVCKWDTIIPFQEMWDVLERVTTDKTPILLFSSEPFSSRLRLSNIKNYKYDWIWNKQNGSNPFLVKKRPFIFNENINVFYKKQCNFYPQKVPKRPECNSHRVSEASKKMVPLNSEIFGYNENSENKYFKKSRYYNDDGFRYPNNILTVNSQSKECNNSNRYHPTQKPVKLLSYLIKNYTLEGDTVLDFTMGSGSTGVACLQTNRNFIGIELEEKYYNIAQKRCREYQTTLGV